MAQAYERKFFSDLGLDQNLKSDEEILDVVENWASKSLTSELILGRDIVYDSQRDSCPYATIFVLFICGQHRLAINYCQEFVEPEFTALY